MRTWVALLVLANAAFFVWTSGWVSPWLPAPWQGQREPQRLANQLNPELVAVRRSLTPASGQPASASPSEPPTANPAASAASATPGTAAAAPTAAASPAAPRATGAAPPR